MTLAPEHLIIAPSLIPCGAGAVMLIYDDRQRRAKLTVSLVAAVATLLCALELLSRAKTLGPGSAELGLYRLGDWGAPWGIVLVNDRLSALMLVLTWLLEKAVGAEPQDQREATPLLNRTQW